MRSSAAPAAQLMPCRPGVQESSPTPESPGRIGAQASATRQDAPQGTYHPPHPIVGVRGVDYELPEFTSAQLEQAARLADAYRQRLFRHPGPAVGTLTPLRETLARLRTQFSRAEAERVALAHANGFQLNATHLTRDITKLRELGSLTAVIEFHNAQQKLGGMNETRLRDHLAHDPAYTKLYEIVHTGAIADIDPLFTPNTRTAPIRDLQRRLLPVYHQAAAAMHAANRVLIFPVDELTEAERSQIHMANEFHWRPEPGKPAGRPLMDCSNAPPGQTPLNTEFTKLKGIERYQQVRLPGFKEILTEWDAYRRDRQLSWRDMWMFKADISNCFNQLHWAPSTAKLMGFMLSSTLLMIMLTCGFGVAVTPMIWSVVGDALNRTITATAPTKVSTFADDFFGAGTATDAAKSQSITHATINGVLGDDGISVKKNVYAQTAEILGILVDFPTATVRPKDKAIEKLFYVLFSVDVSKPQPLRYWQCLASLTNLYSTVIHGVRAFVAPLIHMTQRAHKSRHTKATANAQFAIEIWRAVIVVAYLDPATIAIPIAEYLGAPADLQPFVIVSDASPWRLCAAIYHPTSGDLLAWTTYRLPYENDLYGQHQGHREYLGHLLSSILLVVYAHLSGATRPLLYQWINDNTGALQWAATHKCASLASQYACLAVAQVHFQAQVRLAPPTHRPGAQMGDIDRMSRISDSEHPVHPTVRERCPTLHPSLYIPLQENMALRTLYETIDPSILRPHHSDHHHAFITVLDKVNDLLLSLSTQVPVVSHT